MLRPKPACARPLAPGFVRLIRFGPSLLPLLLFAIAYCQARRRRRLSTERCGNDVTRTRAGSPHSGRAGMAALKGSPGRRAPFDPAVRIALAGGATSRMGPGVARGSVGPTLVAGGTVADFGASGVVGARLAAAD